jgi:hypothetical protein
MRKPTPKQLRRIGRSLQATFGFSMLPAIISENKALAIVFWSLGAIGVFLTTYYQHEKTVIDSTTGQPGAN